jgi:hypothetical protein
MTDNKPNCYQCIHRRSLAGDAHSSCAHPDACGDKDPLTALMAMLGASTGDVGAMQKLGIVGDPHGIKNGWFFWPFNFDPVWLRACNGFTPREGGE